jgi:16S rRNA processing protein RimM
MATDQSYITVAKIVAPFGIRGELKAALLTDFPDRLANRTKVFLGREGEMPRSHTIRGIRFHKGHALITLAGCDDRNAAELLRDLFIFIPADEAAQPPAGAYYIHQIIGLDVFDAAGLLWGRITDVLETPSNDVYIVTGERGQFLLPAIPDFVRQVDLEQKRIIADMDRV